MCQNCLMLGANSDLLFGNPFLMAWTSVAHSSSPMAALMISDQLTTGISLALSAAHVVTAGSSTRSMFEVWSLVGYAWYMDDFEAVSESFLFELRDSWVGNGFQ